VSEVLLSNEAEKAVLVLKKEHEHLFYMHKGKFEVIFRPLTIRELKSATSAGQGITEVEINDWIVSKAILYVSLGLPMLLEDSPAGLIDTIADRVVTLSGYSSPEDFAEGLVNARESIASVEGLISTYLCAVFKMTPDSVQDLNFLQQMSHLALAEQIMDRPVDLETLLSGSEPAAQRGGMLSKAAADKPNMKKDNAMLNQFLTGRDRMGVD